MIDTNELLAQKWDLKKSQGEDGYLYYVGKDGFVWATPMKHNTRGKKKKVGSEKISNEEGFMYYLGKDGYVYKAKLKNA